MSSRNLREILEETDALTYVNALKVTLTELKSEISSHDDLVLYLSQSQERTKKLLRRADGQYRIIAKLATKEATVANHLTIEDTIEDYDAFKEEMEANGQ